MGSRRLERYLDGLLSRQEQAAFERDLVDDAVLRSELEAQREIDAFLGARFEPPQDLDLCLPAAAPLPMADARRGFGVRHVLAAAVFFALALGAAILGSSGDRGGGADDRSAPVQLAQGPAGSPTNPSSPQPYGVQVTVPDIASLYERLSEAGLTSLGPGELLTPRDASRSPGADTSFAESMELRYEECLDVELPACTLFGPYEAPEWPSATVMIGICDGADEAPLLLVVDDQTMLGCALSPRTGDLRPFYKEVNGLAVWEISAGDRPLLLDSVRSCQ